MKLLNVGCGDRYGIWTIQHLAGKTKRGVKMWWCICDCGAERAVSSTSLLYGRSKSCGCDRDAKSLARSTKHTKAKRGQRSPEYRAWQDMMKRCFQKTFKDWHRYGGRGITVCLKWRTAAVFLSEIPPKPPGNYTLGRVNNDGNYEPGNVEWQDAPTQARNTCRTRWFTLGGVTLCLKDMAELYGLGESVVRKRINRGWSTEAAFTTPKK